MFKGETIHGNLLLRYCYRNLISLKLMYVYIKLYSHEDFIFTNISQNLNQQRGCILINFIYINNFVSSPMQFFTWSRRIYTSPCTNVSCIKIDVWSFNHFLIKLFCTKKGKITTNCTLIVNVFFSIMILVIMMGSDTKDELFSCNFSSRF